MDEENNIQGNKALVSNNHADGEVNESSRDGETNTPVYIPQEPMSTKQDKNEDLNLAEDIPEDLILKIESVKCSRCIRERKIYSNFLCKSCYNILHLNKETHKINVEKWRLKNPTYQRDYSRLKYSKYKDEWKKEMEEKDLNTPSN